jgi:hemerythrin-like domain-containing protein
MLMRSAQHGFMDLFDPAPDFTQPIDALMTCHRRIEQKLVVLNKLARHLTQRGPNEEARVAAAGIRRYFCMAAPMHHQDEEADLFPLLLQQAKKPEMQARAFDIIARLMVEHRQFEALWCEIEPVLTMIATGENQTFAPDLIKHFSHAYRQHIANEESILLPMAQHLLSAGQLATLGSSMKARRMQK